MATEETYVMPNGGFGGNDGLWIFALLILLMGGNGFGYGNRGGEQYATTADVQRSADFATLERENNEIMMHSSDNTQQIITAVKDANYQSLMETNDVEQMLNAGISEIKSSVNANNQAIADVKYTNAMNTASINAAIIADGQKTRDLIQGNKIEALQQKINQLELDNALGSVVRYPTSMSYALGNNPFCSCNCGGVMNI